MYAESKLCNEASGINKDGKTWRWNRACAMKRFYEAHAFDAGYSRGTRLKKHCAIPQSQLVSFDGAMCLEVDSQFVP